MTEMSDVINESCESERKRCADIAERHAHFYPRGSQGRRALEDVAREIRLGAPSLTILKNDSDDNGIAAD